MMYGTEQNRTISISIDGIKFDVNLYRGCVDGLGYDLLRG